MREFAPTPYLEINLAWQRNFIVLSDIGIKDLSPEYGKGHIMVGLAAALFVGLFAFGQQMIGWSKATNDEVQLALFITFLLGIICGYKTKG